MLFREEPICCYFQWRSTFKSSRS